MQMKAHSHWQFQFVQFIVSVIWFAVCFTNIFAKNFSANQNHHQLTYVSS